MEYVGSAYWKSKLEWLAGRKQTLMHRVISVDCMNVPLDELKVMSEFKYVHKIKLRVYEPLDFGDMLDNEFAEFKVKSASWGGGGAMKYTLTRATNAADVLDASSEQNRAGDNQELTSVD